LLVFSGNLFGNQNVWNHTFKRKYSKHLGVIRDCFIFATHPVLAKLVHILTSCDLTFSSGIPSTSTSKWGEKIKYPSSSAWHTPDQMKESRHFYFLNLGKNMLQLKQALASYRGSSGSSLSLSMWDLSWTQWHVKENFLGTRFSLSVVIPLTQITTNDT
jgi:hypothetical protein